MNSFQIPETSIIILNWNGLEHLCECLTSISRQTYKDFECILVDNGSTDGSVAFVKSHFPWVILLQLEENKGFAEANNIGLAESRGKFVVTLNNDTVTDEAWLEELCKTARNNAKVGMVASRICSYYDHDEIDSLGLKICIDGMSRGAFRGRSFSQLREVPTEILLPSACAALYKREMLIKTGFFDSRFFAYCEDTDLGLRCRRFGWQAVLAAKAIVYHKYSATTGSLSPLKLYLVERNHFWVAAKNFPLLLLLLMPVTTLNRYFFQLIVLKKSHHSRALKNKHDHFNLLKFYLKGIFHGLMLSFSLIFKRFFRPGKDSPEPVSSRLLQKFMMTYQELLS